MESQFISLWKVRLFNLTSVCWFLYWRVEMGHGLSSWYSWPGWNPRDRKRIRFLKTQSPIWKWRDNEWLPGTFTKVPEWVLQCREENKTNTSSQSQFKDPYLYTIASHPPSPLYVPWAGCLGTIALLLRRGTAGNMCSPGRHVISLKICKDVSYAL